MQINNNTTKGSAATLAGRLCRTGFHATTVAAPALRQPEANGGASFTIPLTFKEAMDQVVTEMTFP